MDYRNYATDKEREHHYFTEVYEAIFAHLREAPVHLLEVGSYTGHCLRLWQDFFPHPEGIFVGLDLRPPLPGIADGKTLFFYQGNQQDPTILQEISQTHGKWDIVIDDGCHCGHPTMAAMISLWPFVKAGGIYVVEDIFYAFPHAYTRQPDGDPEMERVLHEVVHLLPEMGIRKLGIDYRRNSGLLWMKKEHDPKWIGPDGVPTGLMFEKIRETPPVPAA